MKLKLSLLLAIVACSLPFSEIVAQTLHINVENIKKSTKGSIRVAVFTDEKSFKKENEYFAVVCNKSEVKDGKLFVEIPLKAGVYGISVLDDENNSGKMEYNLLGIPKEGFGFSNFNLRRMRKPKFADFSFEVAEDEIKDIQVKMRYI